MTLEQALEATNRHVIELNYDIGLLPEMERTLYLIDSLNFELASGGVLQWLLNRSGAYAIETHSALVAIGADSAASLIHEIIRTFPNSTIPNDDNARVDSVNRIRENVYSRWREIEDEILNWPDDIDGLLRDYVSRIAGG